MQQTMLDFLTNYGYIALYLLLAAGIVGIPVPDETLMTVAGSMTATGGPLSFTLAITVAYAGSMTGMLVSYVLGLKVGKPFLFKFGKWIKLTPHRIERAETWFHKYGLWAVFFGYFVPGIRHFTCYLAGVSGVKWWKYVMYAGAGGFIWCATFFTLGHIIGENADEMLHVIHRFFGICISVIAVIVIVSLFFYIRYRRNKVPHS
ncbi:DedA family protein [Paenibacillus chartarius]|uniref:DedA family protein n=1 Tax=Paenibacillus chartarius TaxID=747481 RepID=A0ABV6DER8_9BACL